MLAFPSTRVRNVFRHFIVRHNSDREPKRSSSPRRLTEKSKEASFQPQVFARNIPTCLCHPRSDSPSQQQLATRPRESGRASLSCTRAHRQASAFDMRHHETGLTRTRMCPTTSANTNRRIASGSAILNSFGTSRAATRSQNAPANYGSRQHLLKRKHCRRRCKATAAEVGS